MPRMVRSRTLGFSLTDALNVAGSVFGDPGLGTQINAIGGLVGSGSGSTADQARSARANSYLIGAMAGIVDSARLLLGRTTEGAPSGEVKVYNDAINKLKNGRPDVWQAAVEAGPLHDVNYPPSSMAGDGYQGLLLLYNHGIGIDLPYMGTDDGKVVSQTTAALVQKLKALYQNPNRTATGNIPPGTVVTATPPGQPIGTGGMFGSLTKPLGTTGVLAGIPMWAALALAGAAVYAMTRKRS